MNFYLCDCGIVIAEERGLVNGRYQVNYMTLDGQPITHCPGCGKELQTEYGPSQAERQREETLPAWAWASHGSDDGLFR